MIKIIEKYPGYKVLAEDASTLEFYKIDNITKEIEKLYQIYEVDHDNKTIYLEAVKHDSYILIAANDALELPLSVAKNLNEAAEFMNVTATHLYRAYRNAGRPDQLTYNNFKLIKIFL